MKHSVYIHRSRDKPHAFTIISGAFQSILQKIWSRDDLVIKTPTIHRESDARTKCYIMAIKSANFRVHFLILILLFMGGVLVDYGDF